MILDVSTGDRFLFLGGNVRGIYTVEGDPTAEPVALRDEDGTIAHIARLDLAVLQGNGGAIRTVKQGTVVRALTSQELKGLYDPPKNGKLTERQFEEWRIRRDDVRRAARLLFYVNEHDASDYGKGSDLTVFIEETRPRAEAAGYDGTALGFDSAPSPSSISKALRIGKPNQRTFTSYLRKTGGARKKSKFPQFVYDLGNETVAFYYSAGHILYVHAHKWFDERFFPRRAEWAATASDVAAWEDWDREPPNIQTLTNWIQAARC